MKVLHMLVGLPRSGKSTKARELHYPIVCPDAIRLALHGQAFVSDAEPMVWAMTRYMVKALFIAGHENVILDATNMTRKRREEWKATEWKRRFIVMPATAEICVARAVVDRREELIPVIRRMASEFESLGDDERDWA